MTRCSRAMSCAVVCTCPSGGRRTTSGRRPPSTRYVRLLRPPGDDPRGQRAVAHHVRVLAAQVRLQLRHVEPGWVRHASASSSTTSPGGTSSYRPVGMLPDQTTRSRSIAARIPSGIGTGRRVSSSTKTCTNRPSASSSPSRRMPSSHVDARRPQATGPQARPRAARGTRAEALNSHDDDDADADRPAAGRVQAGRRHEPDVDRRVHRLVVDGVVEVAVDVVVVPAGREGCSDAARLLGHGRSTSSKAARARSALGRSPLIRSA